MAVAEVALVLALVASDFFGLVPLTSTPAFLALGWISLRLRGNRWRDVGLAQPTNWARGLVLGALAGLGLELVATFVTVPLLSILVGRPPELSEFRSTVGNLPLLAFWLALSWTLGAFVEELAYRGYLMTRVADIGEGSPGAWLVSLLVTSALFGWGHATQGLTGMLQEGFAAILLGLLYLGCGRNLVVPIVAHGVANSLAFVLIFFGRYPGL